MGFCEVLTIVFIILKITNVITWSWFLVFSPLIVVYGLFSIILAIWMILTY
jgi:hypothetical protein